MKRKIQQSVVVLLLCFSSFAAQAEEIFYYHTDNFGTPMAMTDEHGTVVWRSDELPFGEEYSGGTEEIQEQNDRRFLGKEKDDETGLVYMGARYLDPSTGRFNRPDPVGLVDPGSGKVNQEMLLDPQRQNRYVYGLNNPYRYVDPDGRMSRDIENGINPYEMTEAGGPGRGIGASPNGAKFSFKGFLKSPSAKSTKKVDLKEVGSYTNSHASGKTYSGKGSRLRSQQSGRRQARQNNDSHIATDFTSAKSTRDAFKQESRRIDANGGVKNSSNYNKIESPGRRYRKEDGR